MVELDDDAAVLFLERLEQRTGVNEVLLAVILCERPECKAASDFLLILWMNVAGVADVGGHSHACVRDVESTELCLPNAGEIVRIAVAVLERRELHEIKRQLLVFPDAAPAVDEGFFLLVIEHALAVVGFALIPDCAPDAVRFQWGDHAVVKRERGLVVNVPVAAFLRVILEVVGDVFQGGDGLEPGGRRPRLDARATPV